MNKLLLLLALGALSGCSSTEKRAAAMSTPELQLKLHQARDRMNGPHYASGRAFDDGGVSNDIEEKEVYENELMRRGRLHPAPDITVW